MPRSPIRRRGQGGGGRGGCGSGGSGSGNHRTSPLLQPPSRAAAAGSWVLILVLVMACGCGLASAQAAVAINNTYPLADPPWSDSSVTNWRNFINVGPAGDDMAELMSNANTVNCYSTNYQFSVLSPGVGTPNYNTDQWSNGPPYTPFIDPVCNASCPTNVGTLISTNDCSSRSNVATNSIVLSTAEFRGRGVQTVWYQENSVDYVTTGSCITGYNQGNFLLGHTILSKNGVDLPSPLMTLQTQTTTASYIFPNATLWTTYAGSGAAGDRVWRSFSGSYWADTGNAVTWKYKLQTNGPIGVCGSNSINLDSIIWGRIFWGCAAPANVNTTGNYTVPDDVATRNYTVVATATARDQDYPLDYRWILTCDPVSGKPVQDITSANETDLVLTVGRARYNLPFVGVAYTCTAEVYVYTAGNCPSDKVVTYIYVPAVSFVMTADAGGPYFYTGQDTTTADPITINGTVYCPDAPCTWSWTISCPHLSPALTSSSEVPFDITLGNTASADIDTSWTTSPYNCTVKLLVVDADNRNVTSTTTLSITPLPGPQAVSDGPYTANVPAGGGSANVNMDASGSNCSDTPCTYTWLLQCPGYATQTMTGTTPTVTVGPSASDTIDTAGRYTGFVCTVKLTAVDERGFNSSTTTNLTVTVPPPPVADAGGPYIGTIPPSGTASVTLDGTNSTCGDPTCTYTWTLTCPGMSPVTLTGDSPVVTAGPSPSNTIDTSGLAVLNIRCGLALVEVDASGRNSTDRTTITIVPPPLPIARTTGPYNVSATSGTVKDVGVDGATSSCRDPDCTYTWTLTCPGQAAQTFTGETPAITCGPAGTSIPVGQATSPITCSTTLVIVDRSYRNATTTTTITVMPPPLPIADDDGPYAATVPPSGIASIQINGSMSQCGDPECTYVWTLQCPGGAAAQTFNGLNPVFTAGPSPSETIDTTGLRAPTTCSLVLDMTDLRGKTDSSTTTVTITPPPLPVARTTGPYAVSATTGSDTPIPVDGANSTCGDPDCTYDWQLQCPGAAAQTFSGVQPYITAGSSSSNIDIGTRYTPFDCNLTLVVTDRSLRTSGVNTRITVTPPPRPVARDDGPYSATVPPGGIATWVLDGSNSSCYDQPCQYLWVVSCPGVPDKTFAEMSPVLTAGPSTFETIDTTGKRMAINCNVNLTLTDPRGLQDSSSTTLTINPPPLPVARTTGPYSVSATTNVDTPIPVDGANSTCGDPDCSYTWELRCPNQTMQTFTGPTPSVTAGGTGSTNINIYRQLTPIVCNMTLFVVDRSARTSTTSTRITVTPPPVPLPQTGGPYYEAVPPGGIASFTLDASSTSCYDPACSYSWRLACPSKPAVVLSGQTPVITAGPGVSNTIDTTGSKVNVTCSLNLTVTDVRGYTVTTKTSVIVTPPPPPIAKTNGPWNVTAMTNTNIPVPVDASNTTCGDPECTYDWLLRCPGAPDKAFTGVTPDVTAGGTGTASIDIRGATGPIRCNMSLVVTDRSLRTSSTSARLTVTLPPAPFPRPGGPYFMEVPNEGIATAQLDGANSTCNDPPCTYAWVLGCPSKAPVALTGVAPTITAGPSPFETIDTTGARTNFTCSLNLTVTDTRGVATTTKTSVFVSPPAVPIARTTGPYNVTASTTAPVMVPLDGANSTCNDLPCTYNWLIQCPNRTDVTTTGVTPTDVTAGGAGSSIDMTGATAPIRCNVTLVVTDRSARVSGISTRLTVTPPPLPVIRTGGPYRATVPPGGVATIPIVGSNTTCYDQPCAYLWTLECPGAAAQTFNVPDLVLTAGPSPAENIDTTGARSNITCNMTLAVTDASGRTMSSRTSVIVTPPPLPVARTTGPYSVYGDAFSTTVVPVDGSNSTCGDPECTYSWLLQCPNSPAPKEFTGPQPYVTAGGRGASIEMLLLNNGTITCNMTLTVVDRSGRSSATNTRITASEPPPPPPPVAVITGGPYRGTVPPGGVASINVDGSNSSCAETPCTYTWTLQCPNAMAATADGATATITAGPSPTESIDTTGVFGTLACSLNLTVTDERGRSSVAASSVVITTPPAPVARTTGPYTAYATSGSTGGVSNAVTLDGTNSSCGDPECTYTWLLQCPNMTDITLSGATVNVTAGSSSGSTIVTSGMTLPIVCNTTLQVVDVSQRMSSTSTRLRVEAPPVPSLNSLGGPYIAPVPPGGMATIPITPNVTCYDPPCAYLWTMQCPNASAQTYTDANPVLTAGPSPSESIDTTRAKGNITCGLNLTVTDASGQVSSGKTSVTVVTPPLPVARTNGPVNAIATPKAVTPVPIDGLNSTCGDPECTYDWLLRCPGFTNDLTFTGASPAVTAGAAGASIELNGASKVVCNMTLLLTDRSGRSSTTSTRITVTLPPPPPPPSFGGPFYAAVPPGGVASILVDAANATCYDTPCSYFWTLQCPNQAPKTWTDPSTVITAGPSPAQTIDTAGVRGNLTCNLTLVLVDASGQNGTSTTKVVIGTPPSPVARTTGPYTASATPDFHATIPVDGSNSTCGDPECTYDWLMQCPGQTPKTFTGQKPVVTAGGPTDSIDMTGATSPVVCNMTLYVTDRSNRTSGTNTRITVKPESPLSPVTTGPYTGTVPPGGIASVPVSAAGSPCPAPNTPCSWSWILSCPGQADKTFPNTTTATLTAGPGVSNDINTMNVVGQVVCNATVVAVDSVGNTQGTMTTVTITVPPVPTASTSGPYTVQAQASSFVQVPVDGASSKCNDPPCKYNWTLACPGQPDKDFASPTPAITVANSPDASIDMTGKNASVTCNLALVVTDRSNRSATTTTTVTANPAPLPDPGTVDAGSNFVFDADPNACPPAATPCTYLWTCTQASVPWPPTAQSRGRLLLSRRQLLQQSWTTSGPTVNVTSGYGSGYNVDMTGQKSPVQVSCTLKTTDNQGRTTTSPPYLMRVDPLAPNCAKAAAAPKGVKSSTKVCSGTTGKYQTINLTPFQDPQGFTVSFNVTSVTTNQLVPACGTCSGSRTRNGGGGGGGSGCKNPPCAPAAQIVNGGTAACVMPNVAKGQKKNGRIYRIYFSAISETGLACTSSVNVCVGGSPSGSRRQQQQARGAADPRVVPGYGSPDPNCSGTRCRPNPSGPLVCKDNGANYNAFDTSCQSQG